MAATVTISNITGGANLTGLDYLILNDQDIGVATTTILKQGADETTDASGNLEINIDGLGVIDGDPLIVIIGDWTGTPSNTNNVAVCYADAVVT